MARVTLVERQSRRLPLSGEGERCSRRPWRRNICLEAGLFYGTGRHLHRFADVCPSQLLMMSVVNKKAYCHQNGCCTTSRSAAASPLFALDRQRLSLCTREGWILAAASWNTPRCVFNYPTASGGEYTSTQIQSDSERRRIGCYVTNKIQPNCCHRVLTHRLICGFSGPFNLLLLFEVCIISWPAKIWIVEWEQFFFLPHTQPNITSSEQNEGTLRKVWRFLQCLNFVKATI